MKQSDQPFAVFVIIMAVIVYIFSLVIFGPKPAPYIHSHQIGHVSNRNVVATCDGRELTLSRADDGTIIGVVSVNVLTSNQTIKGKSWVTNEDPIGRWDNDTESEDQ